MCTRARAHTHTHIHACACSVNSLKTAPTRQGPDYQIFQNIEQYPYSSFYKYFFFCYSFYTWAAHLSQKYYIWIFSFNCWARGIMAPFYICHIFSVSPRNDEGPGSLDQEYSQMKLLQYKQRVRRYHNGQWALEGVFMRTSRLGTTFLNC